MSTTGGKGPSRSFFGRLLSVLGILLALAGVFFITNVLTLAFLGIVLGALEGVMDLHREPRWLSVERGRQKRRSATPLPSRANARSPLPDA